MEMHIAQTKAAENEGASLFPHMIIQQIISENFQMPKSLSVKGSAAILLTTLRECKDKMNGYRQTSCINSWLQVNWAMMKSKMKDNNGQWDVVAYFWGKIVTEETYKISHMSTHESK